MNLIIIWFTFIIFISISEELDQSHYFIFSSFMLYFTYIYNQLIPRKVSSKIIILLLTIPITIFWYVAFVYNDFLCLNPITYETFITVLFFCIYLLIYVFFEYPLDSENTYYDIYN